MSVLFRLLIVGLIIWFVIRLLQKLLAAPAAQATAPGPNSNAVMMRRCAWCKVHIPETESTQSSGHYFCCEAHRDAFLSRKA